ncbi:predicted protein [Thalassiosira pseudonana CCMP1335]|uniref:Uncharacterized protein n=1 Tax=Thalassiosira pseudonana TaxID=35128 RepID=B8LCN5_THAPS|nr:predicted protein [Thalassiosira pseudonana CCMP1335]EED86930.1 predicted protein [Thalassiosira pseudonana CCMP1335]|eukprot:scaffold605_cov195-Alexandrium_tamarense.AAC.5
MKFSKSTIAAALLFAANHFTLTNAQCRADTHPCIASDGITVGERMCVNLNKKRTNVDKCATPDEQIDFLANPAKQARCDCCNGTCASCSGSTCGNNGQLMCVTGPGKGKQGKNMERCVGEDGAQEDSVDYLNRGWGTCGACS